MTDRADIDGEQIAPPPGDHKRPSGSSALPVQPHVRQAVAQILTLLPLRVEKYISAYRDPRRTKLCQRDVFQAVLHLAQEICSDGDLLPEPPHTVKIRIDVMALLDRLVEKKLIPPMTEFWTEFKRTRMENVGPRVRSMAAVLHAKAPDVKLDTRNDPWDLSVELPASVRLDEPPSPADVFDPQKYALGIQQEMERLVHSESFGTLNIQSFYPLQIGSIPWPPRTDEAEEEMVPSDIISLVTDAERRVSVVAGKSGAGKTTLLRQIAWRVACDYASNVPAAVLPIYMECSPALMEDLAATLTKHSGTLVDDAAAKKIIHRNKCLFLLDAYDNMDAASRLWPRQIDRLLSFSPTSRVILATRDTDVPSLGQSCVCYVQSPADPAAFLSCHGVDPKVAAAAVNDIQDAGAHAILETPVYLWCLGRLLSAPKQKGIPRSPGRIVKSVVVDSLVPAMLAKPRALELGFSRDAVPQVMGVLGQLAHEMIRKDLLGKGVSTQVIECVFTTYFRNKSHADAGGLAHRMLQLVSYQSFLRKADSGSYVFQHGLLTAFFAVCHLHAHARRGVSPLVHQVRSVFGERGMDALALLEGLLSNDELDAATAALTTRSPLAAAALCRFATSRLSPQTEVRLVSHLVKGAARLDRRMKDDTLSPSIRELVEAVAGLRSESAIIALVEYMAGSRHVTTTRMAANLIGRSGLPCATAPLCRLLEGSLSGRAVHTGKHGPPISAMGNRKRLLRETSRGRHHVQQAAAKALGDLRAEAAIPYLGRAALSNDEYLAKQAVAAMRAIRSEKAVPFLTDVLRSGQKETVQHLAVRALKAIDSDQAIDALVTVLAGGPRPSICATINLVLVHMGLSVHRAIPQLEQIASSPPSPEAKCVALNILDEMRG